MGKKTTSTDYHLANPILDDEERAFRAEIVKTTYKVLKANKVRPFKRVKHYPNSMSMASLPTKS